MSRQMYWDEEAHQFFPVDDVPQEPVKLTNADRIRAMSDEELANIIGRIVCPKESAEKCPDLYIIQGVDCVECWLNWLKKEVEE